MPSAWSIFGSSSAECGPLTHQRFEIGGRNPQIAGDLVETGGVHFAHFPNLAPVLQPVAEGIDHEIDDGIWVERSWISPSAAGPDRQEGKCRRSSLRKINVEVCRGGLLSPKRL